MVIRMKKIKYALFLLLFSVVLIPSVYAQLETKPAAGVAQTEMIAPDYYPYPGTTTSPNFFGQDHYYTVTFRGNGEAVVNLRAIFSNLSNERMTTLDLRVPRINPTDLAVYQVVRDRTCVRYNYNTTTPETMMNESQTTDFKIVPPRQPECLEYQEPQYYEYSYGNNRYFKATATVEGDTIHIVLPKSIGPNASGSFVLYYRALGYAKKGLMGEYDYKFETLKVQDKIHTLQVGISTDSDLYLKDAASQVNYRLENAPVAYGAMGVDSTAGFKMAQFDNYYQQIGQGSIVKTANDLQSLDSYTVKGRYADSRIKLYSSEIFYSLIGFIIFVALISIAIRFIIKKINQSGAKASVSKASPVFSFLLIGVTGFVASIIIALYTALVYVIFTFLSNNYYYSQINMLLMIFVLVISVGVYGLLLFGPAIYVGIRRNFWNGLVTCGVTVLWLMFYLFLAVIVMYIFTKGPSYPIPLGISSMKSAEVPAMDN